MKTTLQLIAFIILATGSRTSFGMHRFWESGRIDFESHNEHSSRAYQFLAATKKTLSDMGNYYDFEPKSRTDSLDAKYVMNDYWQKIAAAQDQKTKNDALKTILSLNFTDAGYSLKRYHIAAAVLAGADHNIKEFEYSDPCLCDASLFQDYSLCELLLKHGANPNLGIDLPILTIKSSALAKLFLSYKATVHIEKTAFTLLHRAMEYEREPELIELYRNAGLSPSQACKSGWTPLHYVADSVDSYKSLDPLYAKTDALLKGLSHEEIVKFITMQDDRHNRTVFTLLKDGGPKALEFSKYLRSFLEKNQGVPETPSIAEKNEEQVCSICYEKPDAITACKHVFCMACLTQWLTDNNTCPMCRKKLVE